jgi:hypothetical protein
MRLKFEIPDEHSWATSSIGCALYGCPCGFDCLLSFEILHRADARVHLSMVLVGQTMYE